MVDREAFRLAIAKEVVIHGSQARIIGANENSLETWMFDFRALLVQAHWLNQYAELFWEEYAEQYPFQVCGMETAAISLVAAIVMKGVERGTPVNGLYVRKSRKRQGLMKQVEGTPNKEKVILVDDLINLGRTKEKEQKVLASLGLFVSDIFVLVAFRPTEEYAFLTTHARLRSVFTLTEFGLSIGKKLTPARLEDSYNILWKFTAPNPSYNLVVQKSTPIADETYIYFGTDAGIFYAIMQSTGEIVWSFKIGKFSEGKGILSSPSLHNERVYFGAYDGNVYCLNKNTGSVVWKYSKADWVGSSPSIAKKHDLLFIGLEFGLWSKRGGIVALNTETGAEVWSDQTPALTHGSPLYIEEEGIVVIGSNDATIYAYEATTGLLRWKHTTDGDTKSSFAYDPKRRLLVFGTLGGTLYALEALTGRVVFGKELVGGMYSTPLVHGDLAYVSSLDKCVYAINLNTGETLWTFETRGRIFASPEIIGESLWIGSNDGRLYKLNPLSGKEQGYFQFSERIVNKILCDTSSRKIFILTQANELHCLQIKKKKDDL